MCVKVDVVEFGHVNLEAITELLHLDGYAMTPSSSEKWYVMTMGDFHLECFRACLFGGDEAVAGLYTHYVLHILHSGGLNSPYVRWSCMYSPSLSDLLRIVRLRGEVDGRIGRQAWTKDVCDVGPAGNNCCG